MSVFNEMAGELARCGFPGIHFWTVCMAGRYNPLDVKRWPVVDVFRTAQMLQVNGLAQQL